jgi:hypothetical protein
MKPVRLTVTQWQAILAELHKEHPRTVFMVRDKMRRVLGFTVREHSGWVDKPKHEYDYEYQKYIQRQSTLTKKNDPFTMLDIEPSKGQSVFEIHLDFYSEGKRTMFLLKFSEYLHGTR